MPSAGFLTTTPNKVLLDAGVLSVNGVTVGPTRGGISWKSNETWQNIGFDGQRVPTALLDRKIDDEQVIETRVICLSQSVLAILLNQGGIAGAASLSIAQAAALSIATAATYSSGADGVPRKASQLCKQGEYAVNVRVTYNRGDAGTAYINFALAYVAQWSLVGGTKDAAEIAVTFKARNDFVTTSNTDTAMESVVMSS